jgi:hypothetical protein
MTIPVTVLGNTDDLVANVSSVTGPEILESYPLSSETRIYAPESLVYYAAFNDGPDDVWQSDGLWEWGQPLNAPDEPHSWPGVWGTSLNENYQDEEIYVLTATLDLTAVPITNTVLLQWWEWFDGNQSGNADLAQTKIDGAVVYETTFDRRSWTERWIDITGYVGQEITLNFVLTTFGFSSVGSGWYVDDVAVHAFPPTADFSGSWMRADRTKTSLTDSLTYTLYITNSGSQTSTRGYLRDDLPADSVISRVSASGKGYVLEGPDYVEWRTSDAYPMPVGSDATLTVELTLSETAACGQELHNSAIVAEIGGRPGTLLRAPAIQIFDGDLYYAQGFDATNGGVTEQGGVWAWGEPQVYGDGPAWYGQPAHSAPRVWGTDLGADVPDNVVGVYTITLPALDIGEDSALPLTLQWWEWYAPGDPQHTASVLVSSDLQPSPTLLYRAAGEQELGWRHRFVDLSGFFGHQNLRISFMYQTDGDGVTGPGWFVDSVAVHEDCPGCVALTGVDFALGWSSLVDPPEAHPAAGQAITFTAQFSPETATQPTSFDWDWGDETAQGSGRITTHAFTNPGDYYVALFAQNCGGQVMHGRSITVLSKPVFQVSLDVQGGRTAKSGEPGESVVHVIYIANEGNRQDSFNVTKTGDIWQTTLFPVWTGLLLPTQDATVLVGVTVPPGAQLGDKDDVTIHATSRADATVQRMITLVTAYGELIFLPILLK